MTIEELYNKLEDKFFQDTNTGSIFYNVYIFQYKPENEYEIRNQIENLKLRLERPNNNLDILSLNLFEEFCDYLDKTEFGPNPSFLKYLLEVEKEEDDIIEDLISLVSKDEFFQFIHDKIQQHLVKESNLKKSFIFLYGIGQIFPYLRTNTFLSNFEKYNKGEQYKLIVFYPGHSTGNSFSLFDRLDDDHTYRSIKLIEPKNFANA